MKPARFRYHRPVTLDDALALLTEHGDLAKVIAGGQSLVPMMNLRLAQPAELIDLGDLQGLSGLREIDGILEVGALVRHQTLADHELVRRLCPMLAEAAASIGHPAIRARGTLGGSLAHADPAAQLPLVATTLGAQIVLSSRRGLRIVSSGDFFVSVMTTRLEPDELIVAVRFPIITAVEGHAFQLYSRRSGDFALASVAVSLRLVEGHIDRLLLGVGAVEAAPVSLAALASRQIGRIPDAVLFAEVAAAVRAEISPEDVPRVPAIYRRELVETLTVRALKAAVDRAGASR